MHSVQMPSQLRETAESRRVQVCMHEHNKVPAKIQVLDHEQKDEKCYAALTDPLYTLRPKRQKQRTKEIKFAKICSTKMREFP